MKKTRLLLAFACVCLALVLAGCGGGGGTTVGTAATTGGVAGYFYTHISGRVAGAVPAGYMPLIGVTVTCGGISGTTGANGYFSLSGVPAGPQTCTATKTGYTIPDFSVTVTAGQVVVANPDGSTLLTATPAATGTLVVNSDPTGATIYIDNVAMSTPTTATFNQIAAGSHGVAVALSGYETEATNTETVPTGATVTATFTLTKLTTDIVVTPTNAALNVGATQQFTATCTYSDTTTADCTDKVTWTSSNQSVATISTSGSLTAVAQGATTVTASRSQSNKTSPGVTATVNAAGAISVQASVSPADGTMSTTFTLTCTVSGGAPTSLNGKCKATDSWATISPGTTKSCTYTATGTFTPGCQVNGTSTDDVNTPVTVKPYIEQVGNIDTPGSADSVYVENGLAYVNDGNSLVVIDISNPAAPQQVGIANAVEGAMGSLAKKDSIIYTASGISKIFDVSSPSTPSNLGRIIPGGYSTFYHFAVAGNYLYAGTSSGVGLFDITNPRVPVSMGDNPYAYFGSASSDGLKIQGTLLFALSSTYGRLKIFDISGTPPASTTTAIGSYVFNGSLYGLDLNGNYAYVFKNDGSGTSRNFEIINISNVSNLVNVSSISMPGIASNAGNVSDTLVYSSGRVYIAGYKALLVVDVADPANPKILQTMDLSSTSSWKAEGTFVSGGYLYVAGGIRGLFIYKIN